MKSYMKVLGLLSVVMAALLVVPAALAVTWDMDLEVNDQEVSGPLYVERGETLDLRVAVTGTLDTVAGDTASMLKDLRLRAWVGGYEPEVLEDKTAMFDLVDGATRTFRLSVELPDDLDAAESYTLHLDVLNGDVVASSEFDLAVERSRHLVTVQDVTVSPSTSLEAGDSFWTTVRLENMGSRKEEDVRVTVSVPALGLSARTFVDELGMSEDDDDGEPETSESAQPLMLTLPAGAAAGEYEMVVEVSYNRGRDVVTTSKTLTVAGSAASAPSSAEDKVEAVVSVDSTTQTVAQGGEAVFKVTFANLGDSAQLFSVKAAGTQLWADSRVDPSFVSVGPSETGEVYLYLNAHEDAEVGNHLFTLQIKSGDNLVKEVALGAKVTPKEAPSTSGSELLSASTLKLGFVGLVVLLVVIGLIVALRKLKDDDEYPLEPKDGQTYY